MSRTEKIRRALSSSPHFFSFIFFAISYLIINGLVNKTIINKFAVLKTYSLSFLIPYLFLNILVAILFGMTLNLAVIKIKELRKFRKMNKASGVAAVGTFTGLLGGACPGCFVGLFPAVAGLFGITASLSVLPLYGLELQIISAFLLAGAVLLLTRDAVCEMQMEKGRNKEEK